MAVTMQEEPQGLDYTKGQPNWTYLCEITPIVAAKWLSERRYPYQRPLREIQVRRLMRTMGDGTFIPRTVEMCVVDGNMYLVDGQHRLSALLRAVRTYTFNVVGYEYPTMADVDRHYTFCVGSTVRQHIESPLALQYGAQMEFSQMELRASLAAAQLLASGFTYDRKSGHGRGTSIMDRMACLKEFPQGVCRYWEIYRGAERSIRNYLRIGAVAAVGFITLQNQKERATSFWERVSRLTGYEPKTGEAQLIQYFLSPDHNRTSAVRVARATAKAWNLAYNEETREYLRPMDPTKPILIEGTRYDGLKSYPLIAPDLEKI